MSIHSCRFCGKNQDIFELVVPCEESPEESSIFHVCGSCWDAIAEIARRLYEYQKVKEKQNESRT